MYVPSIQEVLAVQEDDNQPPSRQHRTTRQQSEDTREWISIRDAIMRQMWKQRNHN